jgi:radical SAM superfamily enzyme YgiQ (UPF0313 family)
MEATKDRHNGHDVVWDGKDDGTYDEIVTKPGRHDFLSLPAPDRVFTNAHDKRYSMHGNFKYSPGTYMMAASGCWHGKCTFCVEKDNKYKRRPLSSVIHEIEQCHKLGFKEIFDDSGTFPDYVWLRSFCSDMKSMPFKMALGCNMRIGADVDFELMKAAGFRMVLFGIESANQKTLDRLRKGINADEIIPTIKKASAAGLEPHGAFMFGCPGENKDEERKTLDLIHYLLRKGYLKTAQVSIYDVSGRRGVDRGFKNKIYDVGLSAEFWYHQIRSIRCLEDFKYILKGIRKGIVHD